MNLKLSILYGLLVILSNSVIANISEINFIDEEYIEIISNKSIYSKSSSLVDLVNIMSQSNKNRQDNFSN